MAPCRVWLLCCDIVWHCHDKEGGDEDESDVTEEAVMVTEVDGVCGGTLVMIAVEEQQ